MAYAAPSPHPGEASALSGLSRSVSPGGSESAPRAPAYSSWMTIPHSRRCSASSCAREGFEPVFVATGAGRLDGFPRAA